jgi:hypothetical protein
VKKTGSGWTFEEALAQALRALNEAGCSSPARIASHEVELKQDPSIWVDIYLKPWHVVTLEVTP